MKRFLMVVLALVLGFGSLLTRATPAFAEEITCIGWMGAVTVDNLRVPKNKSCTLNGTKVQGTIKVEINATLIAKGVSVIGNVQAEGAKDVRVVANSSVGGSIQVVQGKAAKVDKTFVNGDILYDSNTAALRATNNTVGGNVQAFQNTGGVHIAKNVIDGNLQCKTNVPKPTGFGNIVQGNKEDQCKNL